MKSMLETDQIKLWRIGSKFENEPHRHDDSFQLTVPVDGECEFISERRSFILRPGESLLQLPGEEHHFRLNRSDSVMIIQMKRDTLSELSGGREQLLKQRQKIDTHDMIKRWVFWKQRLMVEETSLMAMLAEETEGDIFVYLHKILQVGGESERGKEGAHEGGKEGTREGGLTWRNVLDYVHEHYKEQLSLEKLAALACVSKYHFVRQFKSRTGYTP